MTQNFAENLINLSGWGLRANRTAELAFNHTEGGLNVRPLMIMSKEGITIEIVVMPHLVPQTIKRLASLTAFGIAFEWDIRQMGLLPAQTRAF